MKKETTATKLTQIIMVLMSTTIILSTQNSEAYNWRTYSSYDACNMECGTSNQQYPVVFNSFGSINNFKVDSNMSTGNNTSCTSTSGFGVGTSAKCSSIAVNKILPGSRDISLTFNQTTSRSLYYTPTASESEIFFSTSNPNSQCPQNGEDIPIACAAFLSYCDCNAQTRQVVASRISIDSNFPWKMGPSWDPYYFHEYQTPSGYQYLDVVMMHEFGHTYNFGHATGVLDTMLPSHPNGGWFSVNTTQAGSSGQIDILSDLTSGIRDHQNGVNHKDIALSGFGVGNNGSTMLLNDMQVADCPGSSTIRQARVTVINRSNEYVTATLAMYLSKNKNITNQDIHVNTAAITLIPESAYTIIRNYTLPSTVEHDTSYYIGFLLTGQAGFVDVNTTNNGVYKGTLPSVDIFSVQDCQ